METLRKNWVLLLIALVSFTLGGIALITAVRLRQQTAIAPTAPTPGKAFEGDPVPACTLLVDLAAAVPSPTPTPTPGLGIIVDKVADKTTAGPGETITYTVRMTNSGTEPLYDTFIDEDLDNNTDYAGNMSCTITDVSASSTTATPHELDDLADGVDVTPDTLVATADKFRIAGDLTENNNPWDLDPADYITCTYQVTVNAGVAPGTQLRNVVVSHGDNQNNDTTGETEVTDTDDSVVTTPGTGGNPAITVDKTVDQTSTSPNGTLNYTVKLTNTGSVTAYDAYFDENLSDYTDFDDNMSCRKTDVSANSTVDTTFEIDDLSDGVDTTPDSQTANLDRFRVAGDLTENDNTWDLDTGDYVTCTYRVKVISSVPAGTNIANVVVGHEDDKNGDQPNETDYNNTDQTTVPLQTQCNQTCTTSSQCASGQTCYIAAGQTSGNCRNPSCVTDADCVCGTVASGTPTPAPSVTPTVPKSGTAWPTVFLVLGGALLLVVGFAL